MEEIKDIPNRLMDDYKKKKDEIKEIPLVPDRYDSCIYGTILINQIPFTCEYFGKFNYFLFRNFIIENIRKIFLQTKFDLIYNFYYMDIKNLKRLYEEIG
ncbi:MAG TPA: hypothetical protein PLW61_03680 [Caldisericia bacterium]|nr:hypothetical protein [Caldisericia bacterium]HPB33845.1 hypothetical protein [Caldisericia bacterium]HQL65950.1 hypothetical protein [Caldisericia bacterium]HQN48269.1 hypothetical protein [Caldisericia bacterium]HQO99631.1 hypothetical protein [Caldisericia bacterium]